METRGIPLLWSIDDRNRLVRWKATGHVERRAGRCSGELASGRRLELASDQQLLKLEGWVPVAELVKAAGLVFCDDWALLLTLSRWTTPR